MDLSGKHIVFTGGTGGIGLEACRIFLNNGISKLAILDIKEDSKAITDLSSAHPKAEIFFCKTDVTKKSEFESTFAILMEKFKRIDIVVNCSGVLMDQNPELTIAVNLLGVINSSLIAIKYMSKENGRRGGLVVNVASVLGLEPCAPIAIYTASKHGVIGFTRSVSCIDYFNRTGVGFTVVCPGITGTPLIVDPSQRFTFDYSKDLGAKFLDAKQQTAEECGKSIVEITKFNKNDSIWIADLGKIREVTPTVYWTPEYQ